MALDASESRHENNWKITQKNKQNTLTLYVRTQYNISKLKMLLTNVRLSRLIVVTAFTASAQRTCSAPLARDL